MEKMIEVRYEGVVVARTTIIRELDTRGVFLGVTEPLPVGTILSLRVGDHATAPVARGRVEAVSEASELSRAGMRVRFSEPRSAELFGTPVEAGPEPEPEPPPPVVVEAPPVEAPAPAASAASELDRQGVVGDVAEPTTSAAASAAHRRIVVDASTEKDEDQGGEASQPPSGQEVEEIAGGDSARIPAPDPLAFGSGGGKKGRRHKRR